MSPLSATAVVLLADDAPANLQLLAAGLEEEGCELVTAANGQEALERAERMRPDLILLDVMMPEPDGFEVCRRLKAQPAFADTPVIFMTALGSSRDKLEGFAAGGVDYLTKPLQLDEVRARVRVHLKLHALQRQLAAQNAELRTALDALRMAASVFDTAREGIAITDLSGRILDVNPAFSRITGYLRDEVIGKTPSILASGRHEPAFYRDMWSELQSHGAWSGEIINRRKSGELYTEFLHIVAVNDEAGREKRATHYVGIFSDITQFKHHQQNLQHIAYHDALTGLPNRLLLTDRMAQVMARSHRAGQKVAVFFLDLDGFKPINDNFGHETGDRVLVEIARRLHASLRSGDTVARWGGDEFVVLLSGLSDIGECEFTARRLLDAVAAPILFDDHSLALSCSIGISVFPDDGTDADHLLRHADQAMYEAKVGGRNQFVFHHADALGRMRTNLALFHELRQALDRGQITVHYQPIVDMATGRVVKAEALVRWHHPEHGMVPPDEFIPSAESGGLIHAIGDFVFAEAARVAHTWHLRAGKPAAGTVRISINRSPRQFFGKNGVADWTHHLMQHNISGELLAVEITEGLLLDDRPEVLRQLNQLRAIGMTLSLDDFGTGYSALSYLKKFNIDYLKIDRSFIRDITDDPSDRAIVESIIAMASRLGIKLVAEGVETRAQADLLAAEGCDMAQGFLYAKPMPEAEFLAFVLDGQPPLESAN